MGGAGQSQLPPCPPHLSLWSSTLRALTRRWTDRGWPSAPMSSGRVTGIMKRRGCKRPAGEPRQVRLDSASLELMQYFFVQKEAASKSTRPPIWTRVLLAEPQAFRSLPETVSLAAPIQESHLDSAAHLSLADASKFRKRMFYNLPQLSSLLLTVWAPCRPVPLEMLVQEKRPGSELYCWAPTPPARDVTLGSHLSHNIWHTASTS